MPAISIQPTYPVFTGLDGLPLDAGYLWFGVADLDPQTNPTTIYWDEAMTIVAPQPIRTLAGYPVRSGTPARIFISNDYSVRVQDNKGITVYNALFVAVEDPNVAPFVIENDADQTMTISMDGDDFAFTHSQAGEFLSYDYTTGDLYFAGVSAGASTADFATIAATVSPNGVTTGTILNSAVTTDKINNLAVTTAKIANANITAGKLDGAQSGSAPIYGARVWVNFNGTGVVAIRASGNVTSITDNGTGDYTVNFATGMSDEKYSVSGLCQRPDTNNDIALTIPYASLGGAYSTTAVRLVTTSMTSPFPEVDASLVSVAIHR
jgi:hypothetical protein